MPSLAPARPPSKAPADLLCHPDIDPQLISTFMHQARVLLEPPPAHDDVDPQNTVLHLLTQP